MDLPQNILISCLVLFSRAFLKGKTRWTDKLKNTLFESFEYFMWTLLMFMLYTAQKMKFSIKDFFSKCDQIRSFLRILSHLLKKFLIKNFIFCAVILEVMIWPLPPLLPSNESASCNLDETLEHQIFIRTFLNQSSPWLLLFHIYQYLCSFNISQNLLTRNNGWK